MIELVLHSTVLSLFLILAAGSAIGRLSLRGMSLGSAGVLFAGLIFGHCGAIIPREIMEIGLLLFVYAVGLQAGPRFFRTFKRHGLQFAIIGGGTVVVSVLATIAVTHLWKIPVPLAVGLFSGSMTCTPALAAVIGVIDRLAPGQSAMASVGYGLAYPFSMIGIVILVQFLPRILSRNVSAETAALRQDLKLEMPGLAVRQFRVTNSNCVGRSLAELHVHAHLGPVNIARVRRGGEVLAARPDLVIREGDIIRVIGAADELNQMTFVFGEETEWPADPQTNVVHLEVKVTEPAMAGRTIADMRIWERFGIVITRLQRQDIEITPTGLMALEMGDTVHVVGERAATEAFARVANAQHPRFEETSMLPFFIGIVLGLAVGYIPFHLGGNIVVRLGGAGGGFIVSLILGHMGRIGQMRLYMPTAAKNLCRDLGLMLFLAGAGTAAGAKFVEVVSQSGWSLVLAGICITTAAAAACLFLCHTVFRMNLIATLGAMSGSMTNPPSLATANALSDSELPTLSYASVYPVALVFKIVLIQILTEILFRIL